MHLYVHRHFLIGVDTVWPLAAYPALSPAASCLPRHIERCPKLGAFALTASCAWNAPSQTHTHPRSEETCPLRSIPNIPHWPLASLYVTALCRSLLLELFSLAHAIICLHVDLPAAHSTMLGFYGLWMLRTLSSTARRSPPCVSWEKPW